MPGKHFRGRFFAAVAAIAAFMVLSMQPNFAQSTQGNFIERAAYCFDLMINNPAAHARECAGTAAPGPSDSLLDSKSGSDKPSRGDDCYGGGQVGGNAGNAGGTIGAPLPDFGGDGDCPDFAASGHIAPFLADLFQQVAMFVWPMPATDVDETAAA